MSILDQAHERFGLGQQEEPLKSLFERKGYDNATLIAQMMKSIPQM